jgi:prepilin-type N-terminal cleavage/methylation domain-containing protein
MEERGEAMKRRFRPRRLIRSGARQPRGFRGGFSLIELLIGMTLMAVGLLAIATMFSTGYTDVTAGGKTTMGVEAARQLLEEIRTLPYDRLGDLNGFSTANAGSLPAVLPLGDPNYTTRLISRDIARRWRFAVAGDGTGWGFTAAEKSAWPTLAASGVTFGGTGQVFVNQNGSLTQITVTVTVPGRTTGVRLDTVISRL